MTALLDLPGTRWPTPRPLLGAPRVKLWLVVTLLWAFFRTLSSDTGFAVWLLRCGLVAGAAVLAFGLVERWPQRLPRWAPRWVLQLAAVVLVMAPVSYLAYALTLGTLDVAGRGRDYLNGWMVLSFMGTLLGPWIALAALLRQREAFAREQALAFELQRSELERRALDARLKLLQAQVEPHFLFNTLANVRTLVRRAGSAEATAMLDQLIAYLRAAVPRADGAPASFEHERQRVQAYLELMRMRMPDRLRFDLDIEPAVLALQCPPMTLLTLVENAVQHGIDPAEHGGHIAVRAVRQGPRVRVEVRDTGVGLDTGRSGLGTGLAHLRERLALAFDGDLSLRLDAAPPHGAVATLDLPARAAAGDRA